MYMQCACGKKLKKSIKKYTAQWNANNSAQSTVMRHHDFSSSYLSVVEQKCRWRGCRWIQNVNNHKTKKSTKHTYKSQQLLLFIIIACNVDRARRFFII